MTSSPKNLFHLNLIDWLVVLSCIFFSFWLMHHTFQYRDNQFVIASKLWSDFGAHIPLIRSFSYGDNIPIQYPTFPGEPIRYHFLFYAMVAVIEKFGANIAWSLNLLSSLGFSLLLCMLYFYGKLIFRRRFVGLASIFLFLFNGSLSFIYYFREHPISQSVITDILTNSRFASFGPWDGKLVAAFWNLNIYTNQRHLGLSFGLSLLALYPLFLALYRKVHPKLWVTFTLGLMMFFMPWLHQAAAVMTLILSGMIIVLNFKNLKFYLPTFLIMLICAIPGIAYYASLGGKNLSVHLGFLAPEISLAYLFRYWLYNLGFYLILLPFIFIWTDRKGRSVLLAALSLFGLANLVKLSPDIINNHKLVNFFMIFVVIYAVGWLMSVWQKAKFLKPFILILIFCLTFSGLIDFFPVINDYRLELPDIVKNPTSAWIAFNTPRDSVFITSSYLYNPASLAGRKTYLDYGYFNWSMGYDEHSRREVVPQIFSPSSNLPTICQLLKSENLDYVLIAPGKGDLGELDPHDSAIVRHFTPSFTSPDGYIIYSVKENCN